MTWLTRKKPDAKKAPRNNAPSVLLPNNPKAVRMPPPTPQATFIKHLFSFGCSTRFDYQKTTCTAIKSPVLVLTNPWLISTVVMPLPLLVAVATVVVVVFMLT